MDKGRRSPVACALPINYIIVGHSRQTYPARTVEVEAHTLLCIGKDEQTTLLVALKVFCRDIRTTTLDDMTDLKATEHLSAVIRIAPIAFRLEIHETALRRQSHSQRARACLWGIEEIEVGNERERLKESRHFILDTQLIATNETTLGAIRAKSNLMLALILVKTVATL